MNAIIVVMKQELEYLRRSISSRKKSTVRRTPYATYKGDHKYAVACFKSSAVDAIFDEAIVSALCSITRRKLFEYHQRGTGIKAFESKIVCDYNSTRHSRNILIYHKKDIIEYLLRRKHKSVTLNVLLIELDLLESKLTKAQ